MEGDQLSWCWKHVRRIAQSSNLFDFHGMEMCWNSPLPTSFHHCEARTIFPVKLDLISITVHCGTFWGVMFISKMASISSPETVPQFTAMLLGQVFFYLNLGMSHGVMSLALTLTLFVLFCFIIAIVVLFRMFTKFLLVESENQCA